MSTELNPLAISVKNYNQHTIHPLHPTMHGGGGGLGSIISVVAAVAIPVFAGPIAASLGVSSAIASATGLAAGGIAAGALGGAVVGAGLGAITAVVAGQPISRGALSGAIGGAIGGGLDAYASSQPIIGADGAPQLVDGTTTQAGVNLTDPTAVAQSATTPYATVPQSPQSIALAAQDAAFIEPTVLGKLKNIGLASVERIADDPEAVANLTLKAAGRLVGAAFVPDSATAGLTPEEENTVNNIEKELEVLRARDTQAFNEKIRIAGDFLIQAKSLDPEYFANQFANTAKIAAARSGLKTREQKSFNAPFLEESLADTNRMSLAQFGEGAKAYDAGLRQGQSLQNNALTQASNIYEGIGSSGQTTPYLQGQLGLGEIYASGRVAGDEARSNIVSDIAGLNTGLKFVDEEDENKTKGAIG